MLVVCPTCGWNRETRKSRSVAKNIRCPYCGEPVTIEGSDQKETSVAMWMVLATIGILVVLGLGGCILLIVLKVLGVY